MSTVETVFSPIGKLCYPALFVPKAPMQGNVGDPRYSCIIVFDEEALKSAAYQALRKQVENAAVEKWGGTDIAKLMRSIRTPFRDSSEKGHLEGFDFGPIYISPWTKRKPGVVDVRGQDILVPDDVFAGQLVRATVRPFAYEQSGNKGVAFGLEHLQVVKADEKRIDGRRSAAAAFAQADNSELARYGIDPSAAPSSGSSDEPW